MFSNKADAASLLRAYVPEAVARTLRWGGTRGGVRLRLLRARGLHVGFHPHPLKTLSGILDASPRFGIGMSRKLTITLDDEVYQGLYEKVGARRIAGFIQELVRPYASSIMCDLRLPMPRWQPASAGNATRPNGQTT